MPISATTIFFIEFRECKQKRLSRRKKEKTWYDIRNATNVLYILELVAAINRCKALSNDTHTQSSTIRAASLFIRLPFLCIQKAGHSTTQDTLDDIMKTLKFCAYAVCFYPSPSDSLLRLLCVACIGWCDVPCFHNILSLRWLYNKSTGAINSDNISRREHYHRDHDKQFFDFWLVTVCRPNIIVKSRNERAAHSNIRHVPINISR